MFEFKVKEKGNGAYEIVFVNLDDLYKSSGLKLNVEFGCSSGSFLKKIDDFLKNHLASIFLSWYKKSISEKIEKVVSSKGVKALSR